MKAYRLDPPCGLSELNSPPSPLLIGALGVIFHLGLAHRAIHS
jgi:hypothetical protein